MEDSGIGQDRVASVAYRTVFLAAALLVFGMLFQQLLTLLLAVLVTVIVAVGLSEVANKLEGRGVPRPIGTLVALLTALAVIAGIFALIIPPFIDQTNQFVDDVPSIAEDLRDSIHDVTGANAREITDSAQDFAEGYTDDPGRLVGPITSIGLSVAGIVAALVLILIIAYYIAVRPEPLLEGIRRLVPPPYRARADHIMGRLRESWIGWMRGVAVDMLVSGTLLYIGLRIIGLDFAIFFAVLTALLTVVPYFGAIASGIPPVLFAFTDSPGKALLVFVVYVVVQQVEGNLVIPMVMSRTVKLHAAVIAVGVLVVGKLFGFVGLLVAVPILSMITILVEELWVKPMEESHLRRAAALGLPPTVNPPPVVDDPRGGEESAPAEAEDSPELSEPGSRA
jgi:predicted PurR-regulated permease PerM